MVNFNLVFLFVNLTFAYFTIKEIFKLSQRFNLHIDGSKQFRNSISTKEPVQLSTLTFGQGQILGPLPKNTCLSDGRTEAVRGYVTKRGQRVHADPDSSNRSGNITQPGHLLD